MSATFLLWGPSEFRGVLGRGGGSGVEDIDGCGVEEETESCGGVAEEIKVFCVVVDGVECFEGHP